MLKEAFHSTWFDNERGRGCLLWYMSCTALMLTQSFPYSPDSASFTRAAPDTCSDCFSHSQLNFARQLARLVGDFLSLFCHAKLFWIRRQAIQSATKIWHCVQGKKNIPVLIAPMIQRHSLHLETITMDPPKEMWFPDLCDGSCWIPSTSTGLQGHWPSLHLWFGLILPKWAV